MLTTSRSDVLVMNQNHSDPVIVLTNIVVQYRMPNERINTLKEQVIRTIMGRKVKHSEFLALHGVNLTINRGDAVALVGRNGAGKSTLLKVIARVQEPSAGRVWVKGSIAPMIELGAGFHPELTGRENLFLNGAMLGFSEAQMLKKFDSIVEFSELGNFIDSPLRTYSSGMIARLGFSIAAEVDPEILIIDEALSVGDEAFQAKCIHRMHEFRQRGVTLLFVTHAVGSVHELCPYAVWVDEGRVRYFGDTQHVVAMYRQSVDEDADLYSTRMRQIVKID